jgi:hypothetical protein
MLAELQWVGTRGREVMQRPVIRVTDWLWLIWYNELKPKIRPLGTLFCNLSANDMFMHLGTIISILNCRKVFIVVISKDRVRHRQVCHRNAERGKDKKISSLEKPHS